MSGRTDPAGPTLYEFELDGGGDVAGQIKRIVKQLVRDVTPTTWMTHACAAGARRRQERWAAGVPGQRRSHAHTQVIGWVGSAFCMHLVLAAPGGETHVVAVECVAYPLELRTVFGTSHSSTTSRTNALITVKVDGATGPCNAAEKSIWMQR